MRGSRFFQRLSLAGVASAALILLSGSALAIFDVVEFIDPDPAYAGTGGHVDGSGEDFGAEVFFGCVDAQNDFEFGCETDHPDKVSLSTTSGSVAQNKSGNPARAYANVTTMGGIAENTEFTLDCERVQLKGKASSSKSSVQVQCSIKNCAVPAGLTMQQLESGVQCILDDLENGDIGSRVLSSLKEKDGLFSTKFRSRGQPD